MGATPELIHVSRARSYIGTYEIKGAKHNPAIIMLIQAAERSTKTNLAWLYGKKADGTTNYNDEIAWCGTFLGGIFSQCGLGSKVPKEFFRAKDWAKAGTKLTKPAYGCVAVLDREGGGHVGIVVGKTKSGKIKLLGGNQSDSVNIMDFEPSRITAYRWVSSGTEPLAHRYELPILPAGKISKNEA